MAMTTQQQMLVEQRLANEKKSTGIAYLIWFFLGMLGVHRFYLGATGSGVAILILTILGVLTAALGIGLILLVISGIWCLVDIFLIPGLADRANSTKRAAIQALVSQTTTAS